MCTFVLQRVARVTARLHQHDVRAKSETLFDLSCRNMRTNTELL